ncbi:MAG TPA: hypothetical protein VIM87_28265 [Chitinophaga sp.]|uniref:hypothetical protein n=1 Tax=Chitinophaga sp. TaxID=1869181 RepID=UPI002F95D5F2
MRVFIFFIYLCCLMSLGYDYFHTTGTLHRTMCYSQAQDSEKKQQVNAVINTDQAYTFIQDIHPNEEEEFLISDNVEDEDANNYFARKYKLLTRCYLVPSGSPGLSHFYGGFKDRPLFYGYLSYKYITQRTLRI